MRGPVEDNAHNNKAPAIIIMSTGNRIDLALKNKNGPAMTGTDEGNIRSSNGSYHGAKASNQKLVIPPITLYLPAFTAAQTKKRLARTKLTSK